MSEDNSTAPNWLFDDFVPLDSKTCLSCRQRKPFSEFGTRGTNCRECDTKKFRVRRKYCRRDSKDSENDRRRDLMRNHGLTQEQYDAFLLEQNGVCRVCGKTDPSRRLAVDHDHETGKIRGLLCLRCNRAIGLLRDSSAVCRALAEYLERHGR